MRDRVRLARFYPIVPNVEWLTRILPLGVKTVQLRIKDAGEAQIRDQVARALNLCRESGCQLIVNDYWRAAIDADADFIHLGQEDLAAADIKAVRNADIKVGVSTHDDRELEIALAADADYVALGPVYATKLKVMRWAPQGLERVGAWKSRIGNRSLVAIGGLTPDRADGVIAAGADSLAVITDFVTHPDPDARIRAWVDWSARPDKKAKAG